MRNLSPPDPVVLFCGLLSTSEGRLAEAVQTLIARYGRIAEQTAILPWNHTSHYIQEMGKPLLRQFVFFEEKIPPERLPAIKRETIAIEIASSVTRDGQPCRTVNLDPGYLHPAKVVLATTKDFSHRLYLGDGIFGEVTLIYQKNIQSFVPLATAYPDFGSQSYITLFNKARKFALPILAHPGSSRMV